MSLKKLVNVKELLFDLIVAVFSFILMFIFVPRGRPMILEPGPVGTLLILIFLQFFVALYLGQVFTEFRPFLTRSNTFRKVVKFFFFVALNGMFFILLITFSLYVDFPSDYFGRETNLLIVFILSTPLLMGFFLGFPADSHNEILTVLWLPLGIFIPLLFYTSLVIGWKTNWIVGIISFPLFAGIIIAPFFGKNHLANKIVLHDKTKKRLSVLFKDILFPSCMAVVFIYWQELAIMGVFRSALNNNIEVTMIHIYSTLFLGGLIPMRIMMAIAPPFKPVNVVLGVCAIALYAVSVSGYINFQIPMN